MGWRTETRAWVELHVDVSCEGCDTPYGYQVVLRGRHFSQGVISSLVLPTTGAEEQVRAKLSEGRFGVKRCPKCGYLQAFMQPQWLDLRGTIAGFMIGGAAILATARLFGWPDNPSWLTVSLALLGYFSVLCAGFALGDWLAKKAFVPNRLWRARHPNRKPSWNIPRIVPGKSRQQHGPDKIDWNRGGSLYCHYGIRPIEVDAKSALRSLLYTFARLQMIRHFPQHASSNASGDARDVGEGIAKTISSRGPAVSKLWLWSVTVLGTLLVWPFVSLILLGLLFSDASGSGDWDWLAVILGLIVSGAAIGGAVLGVERLRRWESARLARKFKPEIDELERRYTWQCGQILQKYPDLLKAIGSMDKLHDTRTVTYWAIRHIGYRPWTARQEQAMKEAREMHDQQRIEKLISQNPCLRYL